MVIASQWTRMRREYISRPAADGASTVYACEHNSFRAEDESCARFCGTFQCVCSLSPLRLPLRRSRFVKAITGTILSLCASYLSL